MLRLSRELEATFSLAIKEAKRRRHEYLCLEHILYALTFDETVASIIRHCGGNVKALQRDLEDFFKDNIEQLPDGVDAEPNRPLGFSEYCNVQLLTCNRAARKSSKAAMFWSRCSVKRTAMLSTCYSDKGSRAWMC